MAVFIFQQLTRIHQNILVEHGQHGALADGEGGSGGVIATHTTRVTKLDGNDPELLQPYITCYMWKRTA